MSLVPLGVAIASGLTAAIATVADGALLASLPTIDAPDGEPPSSPPSRDVAEATLSARERVHRALAFLRVSAHGITGGAVAMFLDQANGPAPVRWAGVLVAALLAVLLTEATARALGDVLGDTAARRLAPFSRIVERVLWPVVRLGTVLDRLFERVVSPPVTAEDAREAAAEQFRQVVEAEPSVSPVTRDLLLGVFDFGETTVSDVMVPRVDMIAIDRDTPWSEVVDRVRSAHHSRMPVYVGSVDEIVGVLYAKDLLAAVIDDEEPAGDWTTCIRPAQYIPSTKRIADQLRDFRATHTHIAIVADEYGGTEGLVTIEDILEELVGEIRDEYDDEERPIEEEDGVRYWVSGRLTLDDLSEVVGVDLHHEEVSTIGGLVYEVLGRVPRAGESLEIPGFRVVVERVVRRKVARVFLERRSDAAAESEDESA
jgi:CBS domain containing-hemolysin-like protein